MQKLDLEIHLPDFAFPAVLVRVAVAANICMLMGAVIRAPGLPFESVYALFKDSALTGEPTLLATLLTLSLAWPRCAPGARSLLALFSAPVWAMGFTALFNFWGFTTGSWVSAGIQSLICSLLMCLYFDWRHRRLSPALAQARLAALQARIRPHFFFNAINAISMLLVKNPPAAEEALLDLADVFRALMKEVSALSKLEDEMELTQKYLRIEQMRFGERLRCDLVVEPSAAGAYIPSLMIQPLTENAIIHGVEPLGTGSVLARAYAEELTLNIVVENPFLPDATAKRATNKIALENIKQRLELQFDAAAKVMVSSEAGVWRVHVQMPLIKRPPPTNSPRRD